MPGPRSSGPGAAALAWAAAGLVVAATLVRVAWLVRDALRPCPACEGGDLPDLGGAVAAIGAAYGLLYALLAALAALGLARALARPGRRGGGLAAVLLASLALGLVHGIEGRVSAPLFLLNAACLIVVAALAARSWQAPPPGAGGQPIP